MSTTYTHDQILTYEVSDGIALLTLDMKSHPTNLMGFDTLPVIVEALERATDDEEVKGIIIRSARKDFMAGGDLKGMLELTDPKEVFEGLLKVHAGFRKAETSGKPLVACIAGNALGGGFELALLCHHRICVNDTRIRVGLPEVKLGLLPGAGGTQRLPRLIGIEKSLEYILQARTVRPEKALKDGLVSELVDSPDDLMPAARSFIETHLESKQPWDAPKYRIPGGKVLSPKGVQVFAAGSGLLRQQTKGNYPSAQYAMSCVYEGLQLPFERATTVESRYFTKSLFTPEARNIIRTGFFAINRASKGAARPQAIERKSFGKIGVLGAGMMGAGIAYVAAKAGLDVVLKDISKENAEKGKAYSDKLVQKSIARKRMDEARGEQLLQRIYPTDRVQDLSDCEWVIEAVFEDRELKARVTQESESVMETTAFFASNTSTLPITGLAEASQRPDQFIGLHFFSPVDKMPLVEIIVGEKTSEETLAAAVDLVVQMRKTPIVVQDSRGFFTSRVFATFAMEGITMLSEGIPPAMIEHAAIDAGMPVGPLAVSDEVSIELMYKIRKQTEADLGRPDGKTSTKIINQFVEDFGRLGKKSGKGFYEYPAKGEKFLWPELAKHFPVSAEWPPYQELKDRFLTIMALESVRCLEEGVLRQAEDADVGSLLAFGYPPYTGGVISYIDYVGLRSFVVRCRRFADKYGGRFTPTHGLMDAAGQRELFRQ
ncbi:3-hydroxyacyl-CoA dehydrogenase NAD-binding domain-containing protein [Pontibacter sp. G13]|uniref:3-hydroxyacyl-CoA dehydrogenase NAD-binding domain-containing protein n=1 Tax=Pontibacter sp. G13 TaxID=3074898 RepID=UPI0028892A39|nr:3-hydroxyacyl-CoA dehydrogenase NAD-binding domain-containing protein [Pontibacter sp. G13]WNJ18651.1 3-hydroxyacyl-CoA dehydrogenase NAD-binding domain-containing protein [Pontibacter sp. G13]